MVEVAAGIMALVLGFMSIVFAGVTIYGLIIWDTPLYTAGLISTTFLWLCTLFFTWLAIQAGKDGV